MKTPNVRGIRNIYPVAFIMFIMLFTVRYDGWSEMQQMHRYEEIIELNKTKESGRLSDAAMPCIYAITPTYYRLQQKADLTRLAQTFMHVKKFHWIVVEDSEEKTTLVAKLLNSSGILHTHLNIPTSSEKKETKKKNNKKKNLARGLPQRNLGLSWLRNNINPKKQPGVVYFADDDNTYSLQLFEEMRQTRKISVWPVGLVGGVKYESPIVKNGKVTDFAVAWAPDRPFPIDMAGFAINIDVFFKYPDIQFSYRAGSKPGFMEAYFLSHCRITWKDLEPRADNCTKGIIIWRSPRASFHKATLAEVDLKCKTCQWRSTKIDLETESSGPVPKSIFMLQESSLCGIQKQ